MKRGMGFTLIGICVVVVLVVALMWERGDMEAPLTVDLDWGRLEIREQAIATVYGLRPDEQYELNWGDGTVVYPQASYGDTVDGWLYHRYAKAGSYTITVEQRKQKTTIAVEVYEPLE